MYLLESQAPRWLLALNCEIRCVGAVWTAYLTIPLSYQTLSMPCHAISRKLCAPTHNELRPDESCMPLRRYGLFHALSPTGRCGIPAFHTSVVLLGGCQRCESCCVDDSITCECCRLDASVLCESLSMDAGVFYHCWVGANCEYLLDARVLDIGWTLALLICEHCWVDASFPCK